MHMHSAATLNAGDVIVVGSMKTQDSLNTQHESYEGNNGSCTKNDGSVRFMYVNTVCTLASITVTWWLEHVLYWTSNYAYEMEVEE